ncbi:MAG: Ig-like domain-containing protein, partial [Bacteroidales bacterium]|nr:Ig-like domain-containing protein [Bacteroidales bacterium]
FTNPSQGGINNSSKVVKIYKPSGLGSASLGYQVVFDSLKLQLYPVLKVKYLSATAVKVQPYLITSSGVEQEIPYTRGDGVLAGQENSWVEYVLDLTKYLKVQRYKALKFYIGKGDNAEATVYIDDIRLSQLSNTDSIVVTSETFGIADCRQRGAGGLNPPLNYPVDTFTVVHPSNDAAGVYGNDTWYAKTLYDNLPAGQYVFTTQNGRWADRFSFWASSVLHQNAAFVNTYPNPTVTYTSNPNKQSNAILIAPTGRYTFGWDSLRLDNIDIRGCKNLKLGFGLLFRDNWKGARNLFVVYRVDGGNWVKIDTSTYRNFNPAGNTGKWMWVTADFPTSVKGNKLDVLVHCLTTNDGVRFMFDDLTISSNYVKAESITVSSPSDKVTVNKTLQMTASVGPDDVYDNSVTWSVNNITGSAVIDPASGLLKGTSVGTVEVVATANDGSGVKGSKIITVGPTVSNINIYSVNGSDSINVVAGTLQLSYTVTPSDAPDTTVTWSVYNLDGKANINQSGVVKAVSDGIVYAIATANDGGMAVDSFRIYITNQVKPTSIIISGPDSIKVNDGSITLTAEVLPDSASNKDVIWSIDKPNLASIKNGIVTALRNGTVVVKATAEADPNVFAEKTIVIVNQVVELVKVKIKTDGNSTSVSVNKGTLQCSYDLTPADAEVTSVSWSVSNSAVGSINSTGLFTARSNGTVWVTVNVNGLKDSVQLITSNQIVLVEQIALSSATGIDSITKKNGSLKIVATVNPADATDKTVTWSSSDTTVAIVNQYGFVFARANGSVVITATANDGSNVSASITIHIINQPTAIPTTGVKEFAIYPNPAMNYITIANHQKVSKIDFVAIDGRLIMSLNKIQSGVIDISNLPSGLYTLKVYSNDNSINTIKLMKK